MYNSAQFFCYLNLSGTQNLETACCYNKLKQVLKNEGYVDVKQENAYDEIVVVENHKLKKACES